MNGSISESAAPLRFRLAGLLAMLNALLAIPWFILTLSLAEKSDPWTKLAEVSMMLLSTILFVYIIVTLRTLVNRRYAFHAADQLILWQIKLNLIALAVSLVGIAVPDIASTANILALVLVVPMGILQLMFGQRLLQLPADLNGLLRPYCYLNMAAGFFLASIVLIPLGILAGAISDIMLGTIFFQAVPPRPIIDTEA